uniref:Uncharacterized protein n=1 Tax=Oryza glaberrima TaxID=4538 RepID=I1PP01_ORYGL
MAPSPVFCSKLSVKRVVPVLLGIMACVSLRRMLRSCGSPFRFIRECVRFACFRSWDGAVYSGGMAKWREGRNAWRQLRSWDDVIQ